MQPRSITCAGMPKLEIARRQPSARRAPRCLKCRYASGVSTSVSAASPAAATSGLPLNVPCWAMPLPIWSMSSALPPNAPPGVAAGDRLGEAGQVGLDAEALDRPAGGDRGAALHLVEDEDDAVAGAQLAEPLQVAGLRQDDPDVHHDRLDDEAGQLVPAGRRTAARRPSRSLYGTAVSTRPGRPGCPSRPAAARRLRPR